MPRNICSIAVLVFASTLYSSTDSALYATPDYVQIKLALDSAVITSEEPVILTTTISNSSTSTVNLDLGDDRSGNLSISIVTPSGKVLSKPQPRLEGTHFSGEIQVPSRGTYVSEVVLSNWFEFEEIGTYRISTRLYKQIRSGPPSILAGEELKLDVLPRDDKRLLARCTALANDALTKESYENAAVAANALADVRDPIVVPFLAKSLQRREFASLMISSLSKLKIQSSVDALIEASHSKDFETRNLAHSALVGLSQTSDDPIRSRALQGLASGTRP